MDSVEESRIDEARVRADERRRVASLLEENAHTIAEFAADRERLVKLVALLIRVNA